VRPFALAQVTSAPHENATAAYPGAIVPMRRALYGNDVNETVDGQLIVLYDGVCGLCNATVRFILRHDREARFRFAPLQGKGAARLAARHGFDPSDLDTVYLVVDHGGAGERVLARSAAIFAVLRTLGGRWRLVSALGWLPRPLTDAGYRFVASVRYRLFGKLSACPIPRPEWRNRFLTDDTEE